MMIKKILDIIQFFFDKDNSKFRLTKKKKIKAIFDEKKKKLTIDISIDIKLGINIPETAFIIQKELDKFIDEEEFEISDKKINIYVDGVF